jgi:hypothetical protein
MVLMCPKKLKWFSRSVPTPRLSGIRHNPLRAAHE